LLAAAGEGFGEGGVRTIEAFPLAERDSESANH